MITKFYSKKQLSVAAGVSRMTLYRWMLEDQPPKTKLSIEPSSKKHLFKPGSAWKPVTNAVIGISSKSCMRS